MKQLSAARRIPSAAPHRALWFAGSTALLALGLVLPLVPVAAAEPATPQPDPEIAAERVPAVATGGWWDGTAVMATAAAAVTDQGACAALDGWTLGLLGSATVAKACGGAEGSLTGSPRGAAWQEGYDAEGVFTEVMLVGAPELTVNAYRSLGELDVVFGGGAFAADFADCEHTLSSGWSSCHVVVRDVSLPPGDFVGVGTVGIDKPQRTGHTARNTPTTSAAQRAALVALYTATDGPNWTRNTNWNTTAPVRNWYGITTDTNGNITNLYLRENGLSGPIPAEIGDFASLVELDLSFNRLSGTVTSELGSLTNLTMLSLHSNALSGSIPTELGNLTNISQMYLSSNALSGSIPTELSSLTNLNDAVLAQQCSIWLDPHRTRQSHQPHAAVSLQQRAGGFDPHPIRQSHQPRPARPEEQSVVGLDPHRTRQSHKPPYSRIAEQCSVRLDPHRAGRPHQPSLPAPVWK